MQILFAIALALVLTAPASGGQTLSAGPKDYQQLLRKLKPGDVLQLQPGIYRNGLLLRGIEGTAENPVVIEGPASGASAIFMGLDRGITISLIDVAHVIIRHLYLDGNGVRGHGVVAEGRGNYAHHVTLESLTITGFNAEQAYNGISTKVTAWDWIIRDNHIQGVGTGMYLGDSDGGDPFINGLIEGNLIEDTLGYNLQIKHQAARPVLDGMPQGASATVIRRNVFSKLTGGGIGERARPNVLVGHFPLQGPGYKDHYIIEQNLFFQNPTERLFQGEGRVALYDNRFVNWLGQGVIFMAHNDVPRVVDVLHNTILSLGSALTVSGMPDGRVPRVAGNVLLSGSQEAQWDDGLNVVGDLSEAEVLFVAPVAGLDAVDLRPRDGQLQMPDALEIEPRWRRDAQWPEKGRGGDMPDRFGAFRH